MPAYLISPTGVLTIYHGRVSLSGASIIEVRGVTVLNIGSNFRHFIDCATTEGTANYLVWEKNEGTQRFPVTTENYNYEGVQLSTRRMDFAPNNAPAVGHNDVGVYTCDNTITGEMLSINISGGTYIITMYTQVLHFPLGLHATSPPLPSSLPSIN